MTEIWVSRLTGRLIACLPGSVVDESELPRRILPAIEALFVGNEGDSSSMVILVRPSGWPPMKRAIEPRAVQQLPMLIWPDSCEMSATTTLRSTCWWRVDFDDV